MTCCWRGPCVLRPGVSRRGGWGAGGYFVMRAGEALGEWSGQLSKQGVLSRRGETVDLDVEWGKGAKAWN